MIYLEWFIVMLILEIPAAVFVYAVWKITELWRPSELQPPMPQMRRN